MDATARAGRGSGTRTLAGGARRIEDISAGARFSAATSSTQRETLARELAAAVAQP